MRLNRVCQMTLKVLSTNIPLAWLNVLAQTIDSTESLDIQTQVKGLSLESYLEVQKESWQSIQWILNKNDSNNVYKTKQNCAFENISEIFLSRSWRMQTHSNSQCSQSNDLLVIIYELYNKHNIRLILWHIFQRISFYNTKITSYLHWDIQSSYEWNNNTRYLLAKASHKKQELCALHLLAVCGISAQWIMILRDIW